MKPSLFQFTLLVILFNFYSCNTGIEINGEIQLERYPNNVYVIDLSKNDHKNKQIIFTCFSDVNTLELNLTFSGLISKLIQIDKNDLNKPGRKQIKLEWNAPLESDYTGRYTCVSRKKNDLIETVSWYVYFYPANGDLFLSCPMYTQLKRCLVFYRNKVPFNIPCKALHPKIEITPFPNVSFLKFKIYYLF